MCDSEINKSSLVTLPCLTAYSHMAFHKNQCFARNCTRSIIEVVIRHNQLDVHFYVDVTKLYVSLNYLEERLATIALLKKSIRNVRTWLTKNMLTLIDYKMERL